MLNRGHLPRCFSFSHLSFSPTFLLVSNLRSSATTPPILLGNAQDNSSTETAQELAVEYRNIMLAALRYDSAQREASENSLIQARQVQLLSCEEAITGVLQNTPDYQKYLATDRDIQHNLLLSNEFLRKDGYLALRQKLTALNKLVVRHEAARDAQARQQLVWVELKALVLPSPHEDEEANQLVASPGLRPWMRYYAWRRVQLLTCLEQQWLLQEFVADEARLINQLNEGSDLALLHPQQFAPRMRLKSPQPAANGAVPVLLGASSRSGDFAETQEQLADINARLKQAAADLNGVGLKDTAKLRQYEQKYTDLNQRQAAYTYLLAQKKNALSTAGWAKQAATDWVSSNRADKSAVVLATSKALWAGAGVTLAEALKNHFTNKPVDPEWSQKVLTGVAIAAGTAVATYLLGPVGPMLSGMALGYFYPQPDPVMDKLKSIESKVDLGFQRTEQKLDKLAEQIERGFNDISTKLAGMGQMVLDKIDLQSQLGLFKEDVKHADELLNRLAQPYNRLFLMSVKERTVLTDELLKTHDEFSAKLESLVQRLYRRDYQLELAQLSGTGEGREIEPSISQIIIAFYQRPDPQYFQPFHVACRDLSALADRLRLLVLRYFSIRPQLQAVLAAAAVFMEDGSKSLVVARLKDMQRREADERAAYFAGVMLLDRLLLGDNNHTIYQNLKSYLQTNNPAPEFNLLKGFGLLAAADASQHYEPQCFSDGLPATWLRPAQRQGAPARYYLAPVSREPAKADPTYQLFSFWRDNTQPVRLRLHLALAADDRVRLYPATFDGREWLAQAVPISDTVFDNSFEQWALLAEPLEQAAIERKANAGWLRKNLLHNHFDLGLAVQDERLAAKLFWPGGEMPFKGYGQTQMLVGRTSVLPVVEPAAVGLRLLESGQATPAGGYDLTGRFGLWSTQRALGDYKPVVPATQVGWHRAVAEELSQRLPFRHVLYPGDVVQSLRSANGRYWLQLDTYPGNEPVLYRYADGKRQGSVFDSYDYRDHTGTMRLVLQTDGNLALYDDDANYAVAATHTTQYPNSCLCLSDQGELQLVGDNGHTVRHTLPLYSVKTKRGGRTSYWRTESIVNQDQELYSPNGKYRAQLQFCRDADSREANGQHPNETVDGWYRYDSVWRVGFRLVRYRCADGQEEDSVRYVVSLVEPVSHSSDETMSRYHWDKCSGDVIAYIDDRVSESKQMKVRLDFRVGGEVMGHIVSRQLIIAKNYYGIKAVKQLRGPNTVSRAGVFLVLEDDGNLCIREQGSDQVLAGLLHVRRA